MKKNVKLTVLLAVLILLCAGAVVLQLHNKKLENTVADAAVAYSTQPDSITAISYCAGADTVNLVKNDGAWYSPDEPELPLEETAVDNILDALSLIESNKSFALDGDGSEYGFTEPSLTITISGKDNLVFGNSSLMNDYLFFTSGDGIVHLVDSECTDPFVSSLLGLAQAEAVPDMNELVEMTVDSDDICYSVKRTTDESGDNEEYYFCSEGISDEAGVLLDTSSARSFVHTVTYLVWQDCAAFRPDADDMTLFGLDTPAMTVTVDYNIKDRVDTGMTADDGYPIYDTVYTPDVFKIYIGLGQDGSYYAMSDGGEMIYSVGQSLYSTLHEADYSSMLPDT